LAFVGGEKGFWFRRNASSSISFVRLVWSVVVDDERFEFFWEVDWGEE
jgi:hypothetical protein